jgi:hypothetical protein
VLFFPAETVDSGGVQHFQWLLGALVAAQVVLTT